MQRNMAATNETGPDLPPDEVIDTETLYRQHAAFVASFLRHMGASEADLDDRIQDVFMIAHRKGGYQPGVASPRTWLASLAIRVTVARRRAHARRPRPASISENLESADKSPAQTLEDRQALRHVQDALQTLSIKHRSVFVLFEIEGESCEDIAAMWEVPLGTIYSRLHHARKQFLKAYRSTARPSGSDLGGGRR